MAIAAFLLRGGLGNTFKKSKMATKGTSVCHVAKNLKSLENFPRVALNNIKDFKEAFKTHKRKGRGPGSGIGKTSGRGHKGQGQRGTLPRIGFEGGQTPFYLRVPKHGIKNVNKKNYVPLNLNRLQYFIDCGRIDSCKPINMNTLWRTGAVSKVGDGVCLLATGSGMFSSKIDIEVSRASKKAIDAVESQGGKITCAYYTKLGLRVLLKPLKFDEKRMPRRAAPPKKLQKYYMDPSNRGYLVAPQELPNENTNQQS